MTQSEGENFGKSPFHIFPGSLLFFAWVNLDETAPLLKTLFHMTISCYATKLENLVCSLVESLSLP